MQERGNLSNVDSLAVRRSLAVHGVVAKKRRSKDGCRQHESCRSEGRGSSVADSGVESESGESSPGERASEVKEGEWGRGRRGANGRRSLSSPSSPTSAKFCRLQSPYFGDVRRKVVGLLAVRGCVYEIKLKLLVRSLRTCDYLTMACSNPHLKCK